MLFIFFSCAFLIHSIEEIIHEDTSVDYVSGLVDEIMVEEPSEEFTEEISYNDNYEDFVVDNDECNLVYLLDQKSEDRPELWQYDLHTGNLEYQADIQCSRNGIYEHMQSMTGDNDGNLWMLSWQGNLFRFSTETMECQYVNTHSLRIHPDFYPTAITLTTKNQQDNQEFYLSGYLWGEDNIEIVIAKLTYYDLYFISSFATDTEYEHTSYAPEIISSSQDELFGFLPTSNNVQHIFEFEPQTGEYQNMVTLSLDVEVEMTFFYSIDKYWFFTQEDDQTEIHTFNPITDDLSFKDSLELSVVGSSFVAGCEQADTAY